MKFNTKRNTRIYRGKGKFLEVILKSSCCIFVVLMLMSFNEKSDSFSKKLMQKMQAEVAVSFESVVGLGDLTDNVTTPWTQPTFQVDNATSSRTPSGFLCTGLTCPTISNVIRVTDNDDSNFATISFPVLSVFANASIQVKEPGEVYPAGVFTGFTIEKVGGLVDLGLFNNITVKTYLNNTEAETKSGSSLIDLSLLSLIGGSSTGKIDVGFWTTQPFDAVEFFIAQPVGLSLGGSIRVYHAILEKAGAGSTPTCNSGTGVNWVKPEYPVRVDDDNTGVTGICVGCSVAGASNVIDDDLNNYAEMNVLLGVAGGGQIAVIDPLITNYTAGSFAGFVIEDLSGLLELTLLDALVVETYLDGNFQESGTSGSLLNLHLSASKSTVGFSTTEPFDELRIRAVSLVGLDVNVRVYQAVIAPAFCIDSDGDGVSDDQEAIDLTDAGDQCSLIVANQDSAPTVIWNTGDCDNDGITNANEVTGMSDPLDPCDPSIEAGNCDFDGDGVINSIDIDDDNDGVLDGIECPDIFSWTDPPVLSNSTLATGTIDGIDYTYSSSANFSTTPAIFGHSTFPSSYSIPNQISIRNTNISTNTITFDTPVINPVLVFASIGNSSTSVPIVFSNPVIIEWSQDVVQNNSSQITGTEGFAIVKYTGTFTTISFTYSVAEHYCNFTFGAATPQFCDDDSDLIANQFDLDSDNDGCPDAFEAGVVTITQDTVAAPYGANGFANSIETSDTGLATYNNGGTTTYTYTQAVDDLVNNCNTAPEITSDGGGDTASVNAVENQTAATTVTAADPDAGDTQTYSVSGGADGALFTFVAGTGELTFITAPNYEVPTDTGTNNVYEVEVTVTDAGGLTDVQTISVTVTDEDEDNDGFTGAADPDDANPCVPSNAASPCCEATILTITKD